jgi:hypothetical protein
VNQIYKFGLINVMKLNLDRIKLILNWVEVIYQENYLEMLLQKPGEVFGVISKFSTKDGTFVFLISLLFKDQHHR